MSRYNLLIALALLLSLALGAIYFLLPSRIVNSEKAAAFEIIETEWLRFFTTNKIVTQVAIQESDTDILLGDEYSVAFGVAEIVYGIDFEKMTPADIIQTENQLLLTLPQPEVFSVSIRQDSITVMTKSTILRKLGTYLEGENVNRQLRVALEEESISFAAQNGLFPSEEEVYGHIADFFQRLFPNTDVIITNTNPSAILNQ